MPERVRSAECPSEPQASSLNDLLGAAILVDGYDNRFFILVMVNRDIHWLRASTIVGRPPRHIERRTIGITDKTFFRVIPR